MNSANEKTEIEPVWLITANVIEKRAFGEGGLEKKHGTRHFRGNAKVYIVNAYWGMCENVTVIGHHRASGRYAKMDLAVKYLQDLRMTLCYSPKVIELTSEHWLQGIPDKTDWEQKLAVIQSWPT
jgi:uncharacterized Fe-S cluster protein YjdI